MIEQNTLPAERIAVSSLVMLAALQASMFIAMVTKTSPHPPLTVPLFALGPFLGAAIALAVGACLCGPVSSGYSRLLSWLAGLFAMVSFGPHKWFDPAFPQIWPAVLLGQLSFVMLAIVLLRGRDRTEPVPG